jgi:hypothetical protein
MTNLQMGCMWGDMPQLIGESGYCTPRYLTGGGSICFDPYAVYRVSCRAILRMAAVISWGGEVQWVRAGRRSLRVPSRGHGLLVRALQGPRICRAHAILRAVVSRPHLLVFMVVYVRSSPPGATHGHEGWIELHLARLYGGLGTAVWLGGVARIRANRGLIFGSPLTQIRAGGCRDAQG